MVRKVQVSDIDGAAATAVQHAREGMETVVTAHGAPVARIGPADGITRRSGKPAGLTSRVRPRGGGSASEEVVRQRR